MEISKLVALCPARSRSLRSRCAKRTFCSLEQKNIFCLARRMIATVEGTMPRFVILRHEMPLDHNRGTHFDLMLEVGGVLRTWSLPELPATGKVVLAEALPDHRLA